MNLSLTKEQYIQLRQLSNGYCKLCQKPLKMKKDIYCNKCSRIEKRRGYEEGTVKLEQVGLSTINYQQHLHRALFNCNADYRYRGLKQNRIKNHITKEDINTATNKLELLLNKYIPHYSLLEPTNKNPKRYLYYTILYFIDYYIINNKQFKTDIHFFASLKRTLFHIAHNHIRKQSFKNQEQIPYKNEFNQPLYKLKQFAKDIQPIISPLLMKFDI